VGIEEAVANVGGLDVQRDWDDLLSLADQQRISFARVLLAAPRFAVLEGPATLLGTDAAVHFLGELQTRSITPLPFQSDDTRAAYHDIRLLLEPNGTWKTQRIHVG